MQTLQSGRSIQPLNATNLRPHEVSNSMVSRPGPTCSLELTNTQRGARATSRVSLVLGCSAKVLGLGAEASGLLTVVESPKMRSQRKEILQGCPISAFLQSLSPKRTNTNRDWRSPCRPQYTLIHTPQELPILYTLGDLQFLFCITLSPFMALAANPACP